MTEAMPAIAICVCTYRRHHVARTLASLTALRVEPAWQVRIVVADNDERPSAEPLVAAAATAGPHPVHYVHAPASNISIARNACLDHAGEGYCVFVDDDETVDPDWLAKLVGAALETGADAVLGPVRARYSADAPRWMAKGDFHSTRPVFVGGEILTGYTCNALLDRRSLALRDLRFNLARGRTGGEDTEFFMRLRKAGGRIAFVPDAWVEETVSSQRETLGWLARRRFRMGQTHGGLLAGDAGQATRGGHAALALAKAAYCFAAAAATLPSPVRWRRSALRGVLHLGAVGGLLGQREIVQYGAPSTEVRDAHAS